MQAYGRARSVRGGDSWATPEALRASLDAEFAFTLDPCPLSLGPLFSSDGLLNSWKGHRVFCNPPYSDVGSWLDKAREAELAVYLVPSRTGTKWFHKYALRADEIRFLRGRLRFGNAKGCAPFDSLVLVYRSNDSSATSCESNRVRP